MEEWQDSTIVGAWILIAFLFIGMLAVSTILLVRSGLRKTERALMQQQILRLEHGHELLKARIDASESEKQRIASELHDHFGVSLSTLKMKVRQLQSTPVEQQEAFLEGIEQLLDRKVEEMRDLSHGIYPPMLKQWGIVAALKELASDVSDKALVTIHKTGNAFPPDDWLMLQLYRICQEFVHNAVRHGKAGRIAIHLRITGKQLCMLVQDNGCGFDPLVQQKGAGLVNLDMRCKALEAQSRLRSAEGKGTAFLLIKRL